jgi:hypothetical protein
LLLKIVASRERERERKSEVGWEREIGRRRELEGERDRERAREDGREGEGEREREVERDTTRSNEKKNVYYTRRPDFAGIVPIRGSASRRPHQAPLSGRANVSIFSDLLQIY